MKTLMLLNTSLKSFKKCFLNMCDNAKSLKDSYCIKAYTIAKILIKSCAKDIIICKINEKILTLYYFLLLDGGMFL